MLAVFRKLNTYNLYIRLFPLNSVNTYLYIGIQEKVFLLVFFITINILHYFLYLCAFESPTFSLVDKHLYCISLNQDLSQKYYL